MSATPALQFNRNFPTPHDRPVMVAPAIVRVTAANVGPFTFTGTNSFLLGEDRLVLIDPGPEDPQHEAALLAAIDGRDVLAVLLTHTHRDHSALAPAIAVRLGAPLWFGGPHHPSRPLEDGELDDLEAAAHRDLVPNRILVDGEFIRIDAGTTIEVIATPGHCRNHLCFGIRGTDTLLSGDHVMGWNSSLVAVPDGSMRDYLASIDRLVARPYTRYLPAHGGPIEDGPGHARALKAHREKRNVQILAAVAGGDDTLEAVVARIYPVLGPERLPAARMIAGAHAEYLAEIGELDIERTGGQLRLALRQ